MIMSEALQFPGEYPAETVFQAQDLYCVDRLTFDEVAARIGVAVSTVKRWGHKYEWRSKREELARLESEIRFNTFRARATMIAKVVDQGGALDAFAVAKLETLVMDQARFKAEQAQIEAPAAPVKFENASQAAALLENALERKLGGLLSAPETIDLKAVKEVRDAFALLSEMRGKADSESEKQKGLTLETEAKIKKILAGDL